VKLGDSAHTRPAVTGYARRQCAQPLRHQGDEAFGQSDVRAVHANRAVDKPAAELQREERIPTRDLVNAQKKRPRQVQREAPPEKPMDRTDAERPDREPPEHRERAIQFQRRLTGRSRTVAGRAPVRPPAAAA
jgi:hypothetical protein